MYKRCLIILLLVTIFVLPYAQLAPSFLSAEIERVRAGKAWNAKNHSPVAAKSTMREKLAKSYEDEDDEEIAKVLPGSGDDDDFDSEEELDVTCAPGKGWHERGQRCVPLKCPGGDAQRDFISGICLIPPKEEDVEVLEKRKPYSHWNRLK